MASDISTVSASGSPRFDSWRNTNSSTNKPTLVLVDVAVTEDHAGNRENEIGEREDEALTDSTTTKHIVSDPEGIVSTVEHEDPADNSIPHSELTYSSKEVVNPAPFMIRQTRSRLALLPRPSPLEVPSAGPSTPSTEPLTTVRHNQLYELWEAIEEELESPTSASDISDAETNYDDAITSRESSAASWTRQAPKPAKLPASGSGDLNMSSPNAENHTKKDLNSIHEDLKSRDSAEAPSAGEDQW